MIQVNKKIGIQNVEFTPSFYKNAYRQYQQGVYRDLIAMMNRAETDSHVAGCLIGRRAGFQREFSVYAYSDNSKDAERAQWIQNIINQLDTRQLFKSIQEAVLKKFSVIDFEWEIRDGYQVPVSFKKLDQKYFKYDEDGKLKIDFGRELRDIPDEALVCETNEMPVLLPVLRDFILKEFGLESWASFIEAFGEGIILGKYPPGADQQTKNDLEAAVKAVARSSRGIMPEDTSIEIIETQRSTGDHNRFVDQADKGISISILGHANAVEQSKGLQVGENLSSYKVKREIAVDDMYFIDAHMKKFIRMLIDRNFGDARYPVFEMDKSEPINVREMLDILDTAYQHGLKIHPDEYKKLGLFVYDDQEPIQKISLF